MSTFEHTAILGGGVIGASWAALFLGAGKRFPFTRVRKMRSLTNPLSRNVCRNA